MDGLEAIHNDDPNDFEQHRALSWDSQKFKRYKRKFSAAGQSGGSGRGSGSGGSDGADGSDDVSSRIEFAYNEYNVHVLRQVEEAKESNRHYCVECNQDVLERLRLRAVKVTLHGPYGNRQDEFLALTESYGLVERRPQEVACALIGTRLPVKVIFPMIATDDPNNNNNGSSQLNSNHRNSDSSMVGKDVGTTSTNTNTMIMTSKKWQTGYILSLEDADQDGYLIWHLVGDVLVGEKMLPQDFHLSALQREDKKVLKRMRRVMTHSSNSIHQHQQAAAVAVPLIASDIEQNDMIEPVRQVQVDSGLDDVVAMLLEEDDDHDEMVYQQEDNGMSNSSSSEVVTDPPRGDTMEGRRADEMIAAVIREVVDAIELHETVSTSCTSHSVFEQEITMELSKQPVVDQEVAMST
eukprot:gene9978-11031_t